MKKHSKLWAIALTLLTALCCFVACDEPDPVPPTHEHTMTYVSAKSAGDYVHGHKEHYRCDCGALFLTANGEEVSWNEIVIRSTTGFDKQTYTKNDYTLNYCVYEPENLDKSEDKVPLILSLHGAGARGSNNESQVHSALKEVIKEGNEDSAWMNSIIIAPQCPSATGEATDLDDPNRWVETEWTSNYIQANVPESKPLKAAAELVQQYANYDYVDTDRVYVIGYSMGGFGTWDILARYPDLFAAGVPICGAGPTDKIGVLKNIPIYTFHGTADKSIPYSCTQGMYNAITAAGGNKITFYTFQGSGHSIWNQSFTFAGSGTQYPALETWLFAQNLKNRGETGGGNTGGETGGGNTGGGNTGGGNEDELTTYTFEAENCEIEGNLTINPNGYVTGLNTNTAGGMTVDITSDRATEATFIISLGTTQSFGLHKGANTLTVNEVGIALSTTTTTKGASYTDFREYTLATIPLKAGSNTIRLYHKNGSGSAIYAFGNVDYFKLVTNANLSWTVTE